MTFVVWTAALCPEIPGLRSNDPSLWTSIRTGSPGSSELLLAQSFGRTTANDLRPTEVKVLLYTVFIHPNSVMPSIERLQALDLMGATA
jgi:hypothetical protein